jgi:hypothetical protein
VLRVALRGVGKKAVYGDQTVISSSHAVLSFGFQEVKKRKHGTGAEVSKPKLYHLTVSSARGKFEKKFDAVSVRQDCVGTHVPLSREVVLEEAAE